MCWVEADSGLYQDSAGLTPAVSGDPVGRWTDKSGNANHLAQATSAAKPTLLATAGPGGNKAAVVFDGIDDYIQKAFTLVQPTTVFMVFKQQTWSSAEVVYDGFTNNTNQIAQFGGASPFLVLYAGALAPSVGTFTLATYAALTAVYAGAGSVIRRNLDAKVTGDSGAFAGNGATLGARGGGSSASEISVSALLVYNRDLSASGEDATVLSYLNTKWGVF